MRYNTELERLAQQIVQNLCSSNPARVHQPLTLTELTTSIVPYRTARRALRLETSEEYELAIMRLCAGEGGFACMEQDELGQQFGEELRSSNPDLGLLRQHGNSSLRLNPRRIEQISAGDPHQAYAPRSSVETIPEPRASGKTPAKRRKAVQDAAPLGMARCGRCHTDLPTGRVANFCPHCGYDLRRGYCPQCNSELEPEWRHCVSCGHALRRA